MHISSIVIEGCSVSLNIVLFTIKLQAPNFSSVAGFDLHRIHFDDAQYIAEGS